MEIRKGPSEWDNSNEDFLKVVVLKMLELKAQVDGHIGRTIGL
jgi:hypothetical protein